MKRDSQTHPRCSLHLHLHLHLNNACLLPSGSSLSLEILRSAQNPPLFFHLNGFESMYNHCLWYFMFVYRGPSHRIKSLCFFFLLKKRSVIPRTDTYANTNLCHSYIGCSLQKAVCKRRGAGVGADGSHFGFKLSILRFCLLYTKDCRLLDPTNICNLSHTGSSIMMIIAWTRYKYLHNAVCPLHARLQYD